MWKKIKEILRKHTAYKDESTAPSVTTTMTASVIDLRPLPIMSSQLTETNHQHQAHRKLGTHTLNKTDEHCRSLFNLLPTSLRPRHHYHHRQTSNKKCVDASTTTTTEPSTSNDINNRADYDSGYMSQSLLNRTPSYASCYSAVATVMPISSMARHGSIESLLHGHSKSNPASVRVIVRKNFEPFAQAHIGVTQGMTVTALFSRGPWLYIRVDANGKTGYIPRIICSLYQNQMITANNLSISSTDSSLVKDDELHGGDMSSKDDRDFHYSNKQSPINRYLSHSSAIINNQNSTQRIGQISFDERERRNTYTLPRPLRSNLSSSKERRLTVSSISYPSSTNKQTSININNETTTTTTTTTTANNGAAPTRDTDSSSTQDSGYSESTPFFLIQQATPDNEQSPAHPITSTSKKSVSTPHYATIRRSAYLKIPDSINPSQPHQKHVTSTRNYRHTLINVLPTTDVLSNDATKSPSCEQSSTANNSRNASKESLHSRTSANNTVNRLREFALIRNVRQDKSQQRARPSIYNLPKSHVQIPASIFLNHHRQKQQFGSSHSAFRPVQPATKHKRASSEGHSPSLSPESSSSSSSSSLSSSNSSLNATEDISKRRRLSCDLHIPILKKINANNLTRSVCDHSSSTTKLNSSSRTMSDILCDQFSEINIDAIEKDSLIHHHHYHHQPRKLQTSQQCLFTITKDYRSSRASFSVQRGECVYVLKQVGQACYLVRKQANGQIGFLPKALLQPATSTCIDTFLETHGFRETII